MVMHNVRCTRLDDMEELPSYHALHRCYNINSASDFDLLSAANRWQNTELANHFCLQHCQDELFFHAESQRVHDVNEAHVCGVSRCIKSTSHRDTSDDFGIPNNYHLLHSQIVKDSR